MKYMLGIATGASAVVLIAFIIASGAVSTTLETKNVTPPRFTIVSETYLGVNKGYITISRDTVTGICMASHLYQGVMSWRVPCDQEDMNKALLQQMMEHAVVGMNAGGPQ